MSALSNGSPSTPQSQISSDLPVKFLFPLLLYCLLNCVLIELGIGLMILCFIQNYIGDEVGALSIDFIAFMERVISFIVFLGAYSRPRVNAFCEITV